jgi:putative transcriptional regulator
VESLRGHLLIAGAGLVDPNFWRTVILVGEHSADGAMGVVLNRPSDVSVAEAAPPLVDLTTLAGSDGLVYVGGPVQPEAIVVLADFVDPDSAAVRVLESVGFLPGDAESEPLPELSQARVYAGYAGWGAGQLEGELEEGSWIVEPALVEDVFTADPGSLWRRVLRRKGGPYAVLAQMPDDPRLN